MSEFIKNKRKFSMALSALFLAVTLFVGSVVYIGGDFVFPQNVQDFDAEDILIDDGEYESTDDNEPVDVEPVSFNIPSEMRGTYLTPGKDFMKSSDANSDTVKAEIDKALEQAMSLDINSVIVYTTVDGAVIYDTKDAPRADSTFDALEYILQKARDNDLYTYAIFDASLYQSRTLAATMAVGGATTDKLSENLTEFVQKYDIDGILLDGYTKEENDANYSNYLSLGGGIGFDNFLRQSPAAVVKSASKIIRSAAPTVQIGILTDAVWENKSENEQGSATNASYTTLSDGNADTKGFVEKGLVDFVAVKAYSSTENKEVPFNEVVGWWAQVARENDVQMYVVHATDKLLTSEVGWETAEQLTKQLNEVSDVSGVRGSIFNNLQTVAINKTSAQSTSTEKEYDQVLTELEMTKPSETSFSTAEPQVTFAGASDPDQNVTINGETITTDESGYFSIKMDLSTGSNKFVIKHKKKTVTYNITRKIELLKDVSPTGTVNVDGGMAITVSAFAYEEATVYATINGKKVPMTIDDSVEDEQDRDGTFRTFQGSFVVPSSASSSKKLGDIVVYASYGGQKTKLNGATVTVNKKVKLEDGVAVQVTADQAMTYPPDTLDNIPVDKYYPLPKGAMDYTVGDEITYKDSKGKEHKYYVLASGLRVRSEDITTTGDFASNNTISGVSVSTKDTYTYVTLKTTQKVSYKVSYSSSGISFDFQNTKKAPNDLTLSKNPLFTSAKWNDQTMTLSFANTNAFFGYKAYYDTSGNLVLRFNNPRTSIKGARIAVDAGHGGKDQGAAGFLADYPESVINKSIANYLVSELESRGATVKLLEPNGNDGEYRKEMAEEWDADLFISVHNNSAPNIKAVGTEVYYFYPFSKNLAASAAKTTSSGLSSTNRGAKDSYYHITLSPQFQSVMVECGFMTNKGEYEKLISKKYQKNIAVGIADGIAANFKSSGSGSSVSGGTESVGNATDTSDTGSNTDYEDDTTISSDSVIEMLELVSDHSIAIGRTTVLYPRYEPEDAPAVKYTWKSSDPSVATVNENGLIKGVSTGTTDITVTAEGGASATCVLDVRSSSRDIAKTKSATISSTELVMNIGDTRPLWVDTKPMYADDQMVTWRSNSSSTASIDIMGRVKGNKAGTATITGTTRDGSFKVTCIVTVLGSTSEQTVKREDTGIKLSGASYVDFDYSDYTLYPGFTSRLEVISNSGELVKGSEFDWTSEDTSIATVDSLGYVTAKKEGETVIMATASGVDDIYCYVYVSKDTVKVSSISLDKSTLTIERNETYTFKPEFSPYNATSRGIVWSSENSKIAAVNAEGIVTGKTVGTTKITAKSAYDSKIIATCTVEVVRSGVRIEDIYMDDEVEIYLDETYEMDYELYPSDASKKNLKWTSSNESVVTVDSNGKLTPHKKGSATITLQSSDNSRVKATCRVYVEE